MMSPAKGARASAASAVREKMMTMDAASCEVSIIIVSWNVREHLRRCLQALPAAAAGIDYEVIVVDNASEDGTAAMVREAFPMVQLVVNETNTLYTAAANQGLARARCRMQMLLNPDVIPHPGSIARLVRYAEAHPEAGLLGPRIVDALGRVDWRTGRDFPTPWSEFVDWSGLGRWFQASIFVKNRRLDYDRSQTAAVSLLSGACLLFPAHLPAYLRRLDSRYPMYGEDIDLCRRIRRADLQCVLVAEAEMTHIGGASSQQTPVFAAIQAVSAMNRYFREWDGDITARWHRLLMGWIALGKVLVFCLPSVLSRRLRSACAIYRAIAHWAIFDA